MPRDELAELRREAARRRASVAPAREERRSLTPSEDEVPIVLDPEWAVAPDIRPVELDDGRIDPDAAKVVRRLLRSGHEAYLVGGCVRDLLLGKKPKDFDVATSASPDDVRALFRNSRIIGRRFRLAHVLFGAGKVIETATFRRAPSVEDASSESDLLIRDDNAFGVAHEDAARRDFTINGLFYDIENRRVLDWVGGAADVERRVVRTIGDPVVRFLEDPVRMLRAIKFTSRLDLGMAPRVYDAIVQCRGALAMAARPRLFEELMRLLREGAAHRSMWIAWETGVLDVLLPELAAYLSDDADHARVVWQLLTALDEHSREHGPVDDAVLTAVLLLEPMREICANARDRIEAGFEFLEPVIERLAMPRRIADATRRVVAMLPRLESGRGGRFQKTGVYPLAMEVLEISRNARGIGPSGVPQSAAAPRSVAQSAAASRSVRPEARPDARPERAAAPRSGRRESARPEAVRMDVERVDVARVGHAEASAPEDGARKGRRRGERGAALREKRKAEQLELRAVSAELEPAADVVIAAVAPETEAAEPGVVADAGAAAEKPRRRRRRRSTAARPSDATSAL
jgi:poly(A) polymerase